MTKENSLANSAGLKIKPREHCRWDLVSLGEVMLASIPAVVASGQRVNSMSPKAEANITSRAASRGASV